MALKSIKRAEIIGQEGGNDEAEGDQGQDQANYGHPDDHEQILPRLLGRLINRLKLGVLL